MGVGGWTDGDESAKDMFYRVLKERPFFHLPPPLHALPLGVGNVVELSGSSPSAKTHLLMHSAIHCVLPPHFGGLRRLVFFIDLDCRFDILRFSQLLKSRITQTTRSSSNCYAEMEPHEEELFVECMRRFLYTRCYDSLQFLATLKTLHYQIQRERDIQGITVNCLMIDSIGAFHWIDRASTLFYPGDNSRKGLSLQNISETLIQEIKKLMPVHPTLVIAAKATIYGNRCVPNKVKLTKRPCSPCSTFSSESINMRKIVLREYMPSVWQSFVTLRILVQDTVLLFICR